MTPLEALAWASLVLAAIPTLVGTVNLLVYRRPRGKGGAYVPRDRGDSVLIPARNEAETIGRALAPFLDQVGPGFEVIVLDDGSTDGTAAIVRAIAERAPHIRLEPAPPLPDGWSGKQHACLRLAEKASHDILVFQDADVRMEPNTPGLLAAQLAARPDLAMVSGFPHQETGTLGEVLVIPQIHVLLLGYLPIPMMRLFRGAAFGAGCGQLYAVRRDAYWAIGGHEAIKTSFHDGITLPRAFRAAGYRTDLVDATDLATCRMYRSFREVWSGFGKNATEGMATTLGLPIWTLWLFGGHVLPFLVVFGALLAGAWQAALVAGASCAVLMAWRIALAIRFRQHPLSAVLHPIGILVTLAIQYAAYVRAVRGGSVQWRGRAYGPKQG